MPSEPFLPEESAHEVCWLCPALRCPAGAFDVFERPTGECAFDPADGFRYTAERIPVCVHPSKVGLPPGRYASHGEPVPAPLPRRAPPPPPVAPLPFPAPARPPAPSVLVATLRRRLGRRRPPSPYTGAQPAGLPQDLADLARWVHELAAAAPPDELAEELAGAVGAALGRFPEGEVLAVLRGSLSGG
ncbi:hypothetical protein GCM10009665_38100 [Kitasatospora nipponensis]|uniref:Uncharacterized protein n=1 Tax=Kitasatospora nipponensis TaxID=258049 RepID=A0ABP4GYD5_9ACTN